MRRLLVITAAVIFSYGPIFADDDVNRLAQDNSAFAFDLYHQLSSGEGNLFFSPYSISTALAMTESGARGETGSQMAKALHFSLPQDKLDPAFAKLRNDLNAAQGADKVTLAIANSIWPSNRYKFLDSYIGLLKNDYGVSLTPLDYTQTEAARTSINKWVENKTHDKIMDLIGPGVLQPDTRLTLVNAIYFYGKWESVFQPKDTDDWPFHVSADKPENVPMMSQTSEFPYADTGSLQVLELPYQGAELSMLIVLPKSTDGLNAVESGLSQKSLDEWTSKLATVEVIVHLPKFKITWGTEDLSHQLQSLGIKDAFDGNIADFSGMDGNPHGLCIGAVLHKAFIDVKEEGTEAAAATAVSIMPAGAAPGPEVPVPVFLADHPFLFLIQDDKTGSILFMGRVTDPKASGQ
jgi:serpin B